MKKFKRILAMVIALAMVLGMTSMAAFAAATTVTLTYDPNGGAVETGSETDTIDEGALYTNDHALLMDNATHDAENGVPVALVGWTETAVTDILTADATLPTLLQSPIKLTGDKTIYAVWGYDADGNGAADINEIKGGANPAKLTYDTTGGSEVPAEVVVKGSSVDVTARTAPTKAGYVFFGWTADAASGKDYTASDTYDETKKITQPIAISADTTVYAMWGQDSNQNGTADVNEEKHVVNYHINNEISIGELRLDINTSATAPASIENIVSGTTVDLAEPVVKTGTVVVEGVTKNVVFLGWTTPRSIDLVAVGDETPVLYSSYVVGDEDVDMYAVWSYDDNNDGQPDAYTITIDNSYKDAEYNAYKVFDLKYVDIGDDGSYAYSISTSNPWWADITDGVNPDENGDYIARGLTFVHTSDPTVFTVQADESFDEADAAAFAAFLDEHKEGKEDYIAGSQIGTGSKITIPVTDPGYYFVDTSVGALCSLNSTDTVAEIEEKNSVPSVDKTITGANSIDEAGKKAIAEVGTKVEYQSVITIGEGAINYVFHDKMDEVLSYNNDVKVYYNNAELVKGTDYTTETEAGDTITVQIDNAYIKTRAVGDQLTVKYSATVTEDALQVDPAKNTAKVSYGDGTSPHVTPESETEVYNAKFSIKKTDEEGKPLAGAGFVIKNSDNKYYKLNADGTDIEWVDDIAQATEYLSDANGDVSAFTGLANGTYTFEEKTVPAGYNKLEDASFTIAAADFTNTNLQQEQTVVNKAGSTLPSTGGIGTTIFYVVGAILVIGAGVVLITRRRMDA